MWGSRDRLVLKGWHAGVLHGVRRLSRQSKERRLNSGVAGTHVEREREREGCSACTALRRQTMWHECCEASEHLDQCYDLRLLDGHHLVALTASEAMPVSAVHPSSMHTMPQLAAVSCPCGSGTNSEHQRSE